MNKVIDNLKELIERFKQNDPFVPHLTDIPEIAKSAINEIERLQSDSLPTQQATNDIISALREHVVIQKEIIALYTQLNNPD